MKLVVMIPALNEEATVGSVVSAVPRKMVGISKVEVVVVNDGSTDNTEKEAIGAGAAVLNMNCPSGLGRVFRAGLDYAMQRGADIFVNIDGDGQFDPADIPKLVRPILEEEADFVTCSRFARREFAPRMPIVKYYGNRLVTRIINWLCGDTDFTDVSCGFRAFNHEVAYRLNLFGTFTYTQETFIDLVSKGTRIKEVPLRAPGTREHGKSRVASSVLRYGLNSLAIMLRAVRDIQPLKFFGSIGAAVFLLGLITGGIVSGWWLTYGKTAPFTSLIPISGVLVTLSFLLVVLALLADMYGRHRKITEELLYLARRRIYKERPEKSRRLASRMRKPKVPAAMDIDGGIVEDDEPEDLLEPISPITIDRGPAIN